MDIGEVQRKWNSDGILEAETSTASQVAFQIQVWTSLLRLLSHRSEWWCDVPEKMEGPRSVRGSGEEILGGRGNLSASDPSAPQQRSVSKLEDAQWRLATFVSSNQSGSSRSIAQFDLTTLKKRTRRTRTGKELLLFEYFMGM